jgi:hypothetical protein
MGTIPAYKCSGWKVHCAAARRYHLAMQILDVEGAFKGELALNPKEVFLECSERLDPERGTSTHGNEMGSTQRGHSTCMDLDGNEGFCPPLRFCGAPRDHDLDGREVTRIEKGKLGSDIQRSRYKIPSHRFCSDKILLRMAHSYIILHGIL